MTKKVVNVEDIEEWWSKIAEVNRTPLRDIVWMENGEKIEVSFKRLKEFEFTGLSNKEFALMRVWEDDFWKKEETE